MLYFHSLPLPLLPLSHQPCPPFLPFVNERLLTGLGKKKFPGIWVHFPTFRMYFFEKARFPSKMNLITILPFFIPWLFATFHISDKRVRQNLNGTKTKGSEFIWIIGWYHTLNIDKSGNIHLSDHLVNTG